MAGQITPKNNNAWDPENESWDEYKVRKSEGQMGMGQPNSQKTHVVYVQIQPSLSVVAIVGLVSIEGIGLKEDESRIWFVKN